MSSRPPRATSSPTASSPTRLRRGRSGGRRRDRRRARPPAGPDRADRVARTSSRRAVLEAQGSVLTNKYAEGYPGRRYYRRLRARRRRSRRWRSSAPSSCSAAASPTSSRNQRRQANQAVFLALSKPGDTFMGLDLDAGGHLTHGSPATCRGKWFNAVPYGVRRDDHLIDFDEVARLAREHKPKLIIAGGSAYPRHLISPRFRAIADEVGALSAWSTWPISPAWSPAGEHPIPVPPRPCRHHHHPQDPARPARRHDPDQRRGDRQEDQLGGLPRPAGRPADARHRRQGGRVRRGAAARVQDLCARRWSTTPRRSPAGSRSAAPTSSRAAPTPI